MTFIKKGVVIPIGSPGEVDDADTHYNSIILINDKFYIYYATYDGSSNKVSLAISKDGTNFIKKGVVLPLGSVGDVDDIDCHSPSAIKINNKFYLYYAGYDGANYRVCLAISEDGSNFIKKGVVLPLGSLGEMDNTHAYRISIVYVNDKFYLYYAGYDGGNYRICLAISEDGTNFIKKGVVLSLGSPGEADDVHLAGCSVIKVNDKFYMFYVAYDGSNYRVCLAISEDGVNFVKKGVVLPLGSPGEIDDIRTYYCSAILVNDKIYLYYVAYDGTGLRIALAISEDMR